MSQNPAKNIIKTLPKWYSIFIKLEAKSFEPINALRAKYFVPSKRKPTFIPFPMVRIFNNLPRSLAEKYKATLPEICKKIAPFNIAVGEIGLCINKRPSLDKDGEKIEVDERSVGFPIEQRNVAHVLTALRESLRDSVVAETKRSNVPQHYARADPMKPKDDSRPSLLKIKDWLEETRANEVMEDAKQTYPNGIGELVAEGIVLQIVDMSKTSVGENPTVTIAEYKFTGSEKK
jgi:hypothetical protein